jgi:hypothetical protein
MYTITQCVGQTENEWRETIHYYTMYTITQCGGQTENECLETLHSHTMYKITQCGGQTESEFAGSVWVLWVFHEKVGYMSERNTVCRKRETESSE